MTDRLLELLLAYGVMALVPILLISAIGLPLPASLLLVASGAFAGSGQLPLAALLLGAVGATVAGNGIGYWLGRRGGTSAASGWLRRRVCRAETPAGAGRVERAGRLVARWGGPAVLLTRFLITPLAPAVNLAAGAGHYPFRRFALYDVAGEAIWVGVYVGLGYAFSANLDRLAGLLGNATTALTVLAVLAVLLALLASAYAARLRHARATAGSAAAPELRSDA